MANKQIDYSALSVEEGTMKSTPVELAAEKAEKAAERAVVKAKKKLLWEEAVAALKASKATEEPEADSGSASSDQGFSTQNIGTQNTKACHNCGQMGHKKANCPQRGDRSALGEGKRGGGSDKRKIPLPWKTRNDIPQSPTNKGRYYALEGHITEYKNKTSINERAKHHIENARITWIHFSEIYARLKISMNTENILFVRAMITQTIENMEAMKLVNMEIELFLSQYDVGTSTAWKSIDYMFSYKLKQHLFKSRDIMIRVANLKRMVDGWNIATINMDNIEQLNDTLLANETTDSANDILQSNSGLAEVERERENFANVERPQSHITHKLKNPNQVWDSETNPYLQISQYEQLLEDQRGVYGFKELEHTRRGQQIFVAYSKSWDNWRSAMDEMPIVAMRNANTRVSEMNGDDLTSQLEVKRYYVIDGSNVMHKDNPKYGITVQTDSPIALGPVIVVLQHNLLKELGIGINDNSAEETGLGDFYHRLALYHGYKYPVQFVCIQFVDCTEMNGSRRYPCFHVNDRQKRESICGIRLQNGKNLELEHSICEYDDYVILHISKFIQQSSTHTAHVKVVTGDTSLRKVAAKQWVPPHIQEKYDVSSTNLDATMALMSGYMSIRLFEVRSNIPPPPV